MDRHIELSILRKITNDFADSSKIGSGGYGAVYKGEYQGKTIAVKLLRRMEGIDDDQFINELGNHKKVQHPNIVQLVGYCNIEDKRYYDPNSPGGPVLGSRIHRVLCFEYMEGGSLEERLSKDSLGNDWRTHYKIIKGICQGLCCLHRASILHLDLKPANILLDKEMTPKISDFGLSRIFTGSHTHVILEKVAGTEKYMPPELKLRGETSEKTDIFSLGVTIIDIMAGPQGYINFSDSKVTEFIDEVRTYWTDKNMTAYLYEVEICIKIAIECVHCERNKRPTIEDILRNLNNMDSEAPSMTQDISSSGRGQCTTQVDRRNFQPPENFSHNQPTNMTYLVEDSNRAMSATSGAIGSLLHKFGVLHKEFNLETSIEEDAEELVNMQQVLRKMSDAQQDNQLVKRWASNVREMSYNLEDFIDGFLVSSEPDSDASGVRELTHDMYFSLEKGKSHQSISNLIKHHISKQVQDAAEKGKKYKVNNIVANASGKAAIDDLRISAIYEHEDRLVGIRAPRDDIIGLFKVDGDKNQELRIVSIVGLGGMGKTTLAKAVYDEFKGQYHTRAFVPVGRNPDVKNILKSVMYELRKNFDAENMSVRQLIKELNELLEDKRYFIVIDDIWDSSTWKLIHSSFPRNGHGSRVITTTRIHDIALATCNSESEYVHKIKPLSDEDSRMLFFRRTFPKRGFPDTPRKEEISKYILERCGGMPLAINSIASLLTVGEPDSTWENVWKSLGALTEWKSERKNDIDNMKQILDLSYMYLPDDLKTCLLYVCMYPEDREIQKNDLLRQWIAEGFVSRKGRLDAEDVAENNFKALINMCMIQPGKMDYYNNEVLSYRVHDIILDLMRSKSSEANFIQVIDGLQDVSGPRGEIRRVSVQGNDREDGGILETIKGSLSHARSVLLYRRLLLPDFLKYNYVRVLYLEDQAYSEEPLDLTGIGRLFFLRYLKISCNQSGGGLKLPDQIGHLQQLETIDLAGNLKNNPSDIVTLPWLSHLSYWPILHNIMLPDGIERLKSLHTLKGVSVTKCSVENIKGLGELTNLRELEVRCDAAPSESKEVASVRMNALHSSISRLSTSLRILTLINFSRRQPHIGSCSGTLFPQGSVIRKLNLRNSCVERCPEWMGQLHYLYSLTIVVTEVAECFAIVGWLPSLVYFQFFADDRREKEESVVISGSGAFQALKHLFVESRMTSFTFEEGAMPKLEKLDMPFQYNIIRRLAYRQIGIHHLPAATLKVISLTVCFIMDDWKVKGSEHWNDRDWDIYWESDHFEDKIKELARNTVPMLYRAFKLHHPSAQIYIKFNRYGGYVNKGNYEQDGDEEHDEDSYDDEDFCMEDYMTEEDDESVDDEDFCMEEYMIEEDDESVDDEEYDSNDGMLVNTVAHLNQAASGGHVGIAASARTVQPKAKAVDDYHGENIFWDNLMPDSDRGAEDKDDDPSQDDFWQSVLTDPDDEVEAAVGQA